jgi:hypothetical protein
MLKLLDSRGPRPPTVSALQSRASPALFIHRLIKQRLLKVLLGVEVYPDNHILRHLTNLDSQRNQNCMTAVNDLNGLIESRKDAYDRNSTLHWSSRPKTAVVAYSHFESKLLLLPQVK